MPRRMMRDRRMSRDMRRRRSRITGRYIDSRHRGYEDRYDMARGRRDYGEYYPISIRGEVGRMSREEYPMRGYDGSYARRDMNYDMRYMPDYGFDDEECLSDEELMEWSKDLLSEIDATHKPYFTKEAFERRAKELGISFNDFSFAELYVTALMMATDYGEVLKKYGIVNMDIATLMGKAFLEDPDADLRYGEKLAAYYDNIVCPE